MNGAIGIDIGGTNVQLAIVLGDGSILASRSIQVSKYPDPADFLSHLSVNIQELIDDVIGIEINGIGVGSPGANISEGVIERASNLPWKRLPITEFLQLQFNLPVFLTNDANLFALAEKTYGKAKLMDDFIVVTLGTGVGSGIFANGRLVEGKDGLAGEVGHTTYQRNGRPCKCGKQGCLERYVSVTGFLTTVNQLIKENKVKTSLNGEISDGRVVSEAAQNGDQLAIHAFELTGQILGEALADLAACLDPEAIFISGGLVNAGDLILEPTRRNFKKNLLAIYPREIPIEQCFVRDDQLGVLGASALAIQSVVKSEQTFSEI